MTTKTPPPQASPIFAGTFEEFVAEAPSDAACSYLAKTPQGTEDGFSCVAPTIPTKMKSSAKTPAVERTNKPAVEVVYEDDDKADLNHPADYLVRSLGYMFGGTYSDNPWTKNSIAEAQRAFNVGRDGDALLHITGGVVEFALAAPANLAKTYGNMCAVPFHAALAAFNATDNAGLKFLYGLALFFSSFALIGTLAAGMLELVFSPLRALGKAASFGLHAFGSDKGMKEFDRQASEPFGKLGDFFDNPFTREERKPATLKGTNTPA